LIKKINRNGKGVTLVELLLALALISIVITAAFSIFSFGNKTFRGGNTQSNLQADVRFAIEALTNDVRYPTDLDILQAHDLDDSHVAYLLTKDNGIYINITPYDTYIFYDYSTKSVVKLRRESIERFRLNTDAPIPLEFSPIGSPVNRLQYNLRGVNSNDSKQFEVTSEILMLNIIRPDGTSKATGSAGGVGVKYKTPEAHVAELQYPVTQLIGANDDENVEITFDKLIQLEDFVVSPGATNHSLIKDNVNITPNGTTGYMLTIKFIQIGSNPKKFVDGDTITLILKYGANLEYAAYYDLKCIGGSWTIE